MVASMVPPYFVGKAIIREMAFSNMSLIFPEEFLMVAPISYTIYTANLNFIKLSKQVIITYKRMVT